MGKFSRDKGARTERNLVNLFQELGFAAERVPLSGAAGGRFSGDLSVPFLGADWRVEVKCRADGFAQLYGWLSEHDALIVKADNRVPLLVIPLNESNLALARGLEVTARGLATIGREGR